MRIIAETKDYYDCIQSAGYDPSLQYIRTHETVSLGMKWPFPTCGGYRGGFFHGVPANFKLFMIGFCGKVYPALRLSKYGTLYQPAVSVVCYNINDFEDFLEKHTSKKVVNHFNSSAKYKYSSTAPFDHSLRRKNFVRFFDECEKLKDSYRHYFEEKKCPIFVATKEEEYNKNTISYNVILKNFDFFRIFDPYSAYQEIAMFLNNIAWPNKPVPELSNSDLIESKGFDLKWSFRRESTKKKQ